MQVRGPAAHLPRAYSAGRRCTEFPEGAREEILAARWGRQALLTRALSFAVAVGKQQQQNVNYRARLYANKTLFTKAR